MCTPSLAIWRKLRRYRVKSTGESFGNTVPVFVDVVSSAALSYNLNFSIKWEQIQFFSEISVPCGIGLEITALAFIWVVSPLTLQFSKLGLTRTYFRRHNFVCQHFSMQRAGIIFAPVFGFCGDLMCAMIGLARACTDKCSWTLLFPALRDRRGGPELDYSLDWLQELSRPFMYRLWSRGRTLGIRLCCCFFSFILYF